MNTYLYQKKHDRILGGFEFLHADTTVEADAGSGGASFAGDAAAGGEIHPYTKIEFGASGTQTPVSAANPLPVVQTGTPGLPTGAATEAAQTTGNTALAAIQAAVEALDNAISGTEMQVDVLTLPALPAGTNNIGDVDVLSVVPGTGATNLGKAEDAAHASGDTGVMALAVRRDANTTLAGTDGDYAPLQVNADGSLKVAITAGAGSGGTSATDDAAFTPASGSGTPIMGFADETSPDAVDEGDVGVVRMTLQRALHVNLRDSSGNELAAGNQYAEDAAHASGDMLMMAGAVRRDTAAVGSGTDGDNSTLNVDASGRLWTNGSGVNQPVVGAAAHDAAIDGNPVRIAGRAMSADITAVASGDTTDLLATLLGKLVTQPYALPANSWNYAAPAGGLVNTTGVTAKAAAGAGIRNYITKAQIINSHQTTSTEVEIRDGAAGTVLWRGWAQAAGGGIECKFDPPLRGTANTLVEIAEVTATASAGVLVNLQGFVAAE